MKITNAPAIDDDVLVFERHPVGRRKFNECVRRALRELASKSDLTPNSAAKRANLDASFLRRVMAGKRTIGMFTLFKIASVARVDASDFVGMVESELREALKEEEAQ
ncbi:MAG: helix-turn-helix transcriptional regulator [Opitutaceae bacterium]|jgi:predicted transcriptional regulator